MNQTENYFKSSDLSQSLLKKHLEPIEALVKYINDIDAKKTRGLHLGSALDTLIFDEDSFTDLYVVNDDTVNFSPKVVEFVDTHNISDINDLPENILEKLFKSDYRNNIKKEETMLKYFIADAGPYIEFKLSQDDRVPLSESEYNTMRIQKDAINANFGDLIADCEQQKRLHYVREVNYEGQTYEIKCKSLIDLYNGNVIDLKRTAFPLSHLPYVCRKYRYDFQLQFYKEALEFSNLDAFETQLLVVSDADPLQPRLFTISPSQRDAAISGKWYQSRYYGSINDALERFIYYMLTNYTVDYNIREDELILFQNDQSYRDKD